MHTAAARPVFRRWGRGPFLPGVIAWMIMMFAHDALAQPATPPKEPPPRLDASAQFTVLATTGNASAQALGAGADIVWRPMPWTTKTKVAFAQTEDEGVLSARSFVGTFRGDRFVTTRTSFYGQYDFLRDIFAGVEQRQTVAGGLAYLLIDRTPHHLTIDGGLGYQHESLVDEDTRDSAIATAGVAYRWELSRTSDIKEELRYAQSLNTDENWKLDQTLAITAAITSAFSLKLSNIVRYANDPPIGFETTDTITAVALVWNIKRPGP